RGQEREHNLNPNLPIRIGDFQLVIRVELEVPSSPHQYERLMTAY
ncbi:uncharacterized protein METZ01_LOCUS335598, partial [marine metagenome]